MKKKQKIVSTVLAICLCLGMQASAMLSVQAANNIQKKQVYIKQTLTLPMPENIAKSQVKWSSNNKKIVSVTQRGKITGRKKGTAIVKAVRKKDKKVLAVYEVNVKKFKETRIPAKIKVTNNSAKGYLKLLNKKYDVITSEKELEQLKKEFCKCYVSAGLGSEAQGKKTEFYKKLSSYKKSFFAKKSLCIMENVLSGGGQTTKTKKLVRKQNTNGNVYGQLQITYQKLSEDANTVTQVAYQEYFIELDKTEAANLQNYKILVNKEK